jgi:hypothetical protein
MNNYNYEYAGVCQAGQDTEISMVVEAFSYFAHLHHLLHFDRHRMKYKQHETATCGRREVASREWGPFASA